MKFSPYVILAAGGLVIWWLWKYLHQASSAKTILPSGPTKADILNRASSVYNFRIDCQAKGGVFTETASGGSCDLSRPSFVETVAPGANWDGHKWVEPPKGTSGTAIGDATFGPGTYPSHA